MQLVCYISCAGIKRVNLLITFVKYFDMISAFRCLMFLSFVIYVTRLSEFSLFSSMDLQPLWALDAFSVLCPIHSR
jgi:hypothetical protein